MARLPNAVATPDQVGIAEPQPARTRVTGFDNPIGQVLEQASRQTAQVAADFQTREDKQGLLDYSAAQSSFLQQKVKLDQQYAEDKDFATAPKRYQADLQKLGDQFGQSIEDPTLRNEFSARVVTPSVTSGWAQLTNIGKAREADSGKASLLSTIDTNLNAAMNAPDDATRTQLLKATNLSIDAAQAHTWISATEAVLYKQKANNDYIIGRLKVIAGTQGPRAALAALAPPGSGVAPPELDQGVQDEITTAATAAGTSPAKAIRFAQIESSGDPHAAGGGLFQVQGKMAEAFKAKYGVDPEKATPEQQIEFYHAMSPQVDAAFAQLSGHKPSDVESYLAWQQGAGGAAALEASPDKSAIDTIAPLYIKQFGARQGSALAQAAIIGNVEPGLRKQALGWTSQQFTDYWQHRYDNQPGTPSPVQVASLGASDAPGGGVMTSTTGTSFAPTGTFVDQLGPDTRADLIRQYSAEVKSADAESQRNADQLALDARVVLQSRAADDIASITDTGKPATGAGITIAEMLAAHMKPAEIAKYQGETDLAHRMYDAKTKIALASPEQEQDLLTKFTPKGEDYASQKLAYDAMLQAIQTKRQALAADPAGYVVKNSPGAAEALDAAIKDPGQFGAYAAKLDGAYDQLGVPEGVRAYLPKQSAQAMVGQIIAQPPAERANALVSMAQRFGPNFDKILGSMVKDGGLPVGYEMITAIADPTARTMLADALADPKKTRDALAGGTSGGKAIASQIDEAIAGNDGMNQLRATFGYASGGAMKADEIQNTVSLLAYRFALTGMDPDAAAEKAVATMTSEKYDFVGGGNGIAPARVPAGKSDAATTAMLATVQGLKASDLQPVVNAGVDPTMKESALQDLALQNARQGHWATTPDDQGLMLLGYDGRPVTRKDGAIVQFKFSDMGTLQSTAQAQGITGMKRGYRGLPVR